MRLRDSSIYDSAPVRRLLDEQTRAITPVLQHCAGDYALQIGALAEGLSPPALPLLGCWIRLQVSEDRYHGDLQALADEALPFIDDAFELVLLQHALEATAMSAALLDEAVRVLAPGGLLAITGVHPISAWAPWFRSRSHGQQASPRLPMGYVHDLQLAGFEIEQVRRVGCVFPGSTMAHSTATSLLGGGYVLIARKRRRAVTPLRIQPKPLAAPAAGRLSPSTRRTAAL